MWDPTYKLSSTDPYFSNTFTCAGPGPSRHKDASAPEVYVSWIPDILLNLGDSLISRAHFPLKLPVETSRWSLIVLAVFVGNNSSSPEDLDHV